MALAQSVAMMRRDSKPTLQPLASLNDNGPPEIRRINRTVMRDDPPGPG
jgi:hypothetical protein